MAAWAAAASAEAAESATGGTTAAEVFSVPQFSQTQTVLPELSVVCLQFEQLTGAAGSISFNI